MSSTTLQLFDYDLIDGWLPGPADLIAELTFASGTASISKISWVNQNGAPITP